MSKVWVLLMELLLSFTQYTQFVSLGKCSTIVSNRFTRLSFIILRCSNSRLPSALRPRDVDSYVVCLAYVVRKLSLIKMVLPKVVNSCFPTHSCGLANLILKVHNFLEELVKRLTLQWLCEKICHHILCWKILDFQFISLDSVSDEVISDGDMLCPFTAGILTVFL